jgi:endo-1,4-beta-xylanase
MKIYAQTTTKSHITLRSLAQKRGFGIGAAVGYGNIWELNNEPRLRQVLAREFNVLATEGSMGWWDTHPQKGKYTFETADTIVNFAKKNSMEVRGHALIYSLSTPDWLTMEVVDKNKYPDITKKNATSKHLKPRHEVRAILSKLLREHITTVVGRYQGKVGSWDVVNEAIMHDGSVRKDLWSFAGKKSTDYIDLAFRTARKADPKAKLVYNDGIAEGMGRKSDGVYNLVKGLIERGVPIDGVGLQMHIILTGNSQSHYINDFDLKKLVLKDISKNIKRLNDLGLEVLITEMDVQLQHLPKTMPKSEKWEIQAKAYEDILKICLSADNCKTLIMWGSTDKYSWIPWFTKKPDNPLIFDKSYNPKPAYYALKNVLLGENTTREH